MKTHKYYTKNFSYSRWLVGKECAHKQYMKYRAKIKGKNNVDPTGEHKGKIAARHGQQMHLLSELRIKGHLNNEDMPEGFIIFNHIYEDITRNAGTAELGIRINNSKITPKLKGKVMAYLDGFCKLEDKVALILDLKTGKHENKIILHFYQAYLYALLILITMPEVEIVHTKWIYIDEGKINHWKFYRKNLDSIIDFWKQEILIGTMAMGFNSFTKDKWRCRYCEFSEICVKGKTVNNIKELNL